MRKLIMTALLVAIAVPASPAIAQPSRQDQSWGDRQRDHDQRANGRSVRHDDRNRVKQQNRREHAVRQQRSNSWSGYNRYDYNRPDPRYGVYQADRYYRDGRYYQQRRLTNNDRIYRGSNGRYYCRRNDGTTGLIIGMVGGSLLGRAIAPNGSRTLGAILGGGAGALIGRSIGRDGVHCR